MLIFASNFHLEKVLASSCLLFPGIIPAFETSHAIAHLLKMKNKYEKDDCVVLNFSGKGDKDINKAIELLNIEIKGFN